MFAPLSWITLGPAWITLPVPLMMPEKNCESLLSNESEPLSVTLPFITPSALPSPIWRVPALIVVPPE